MAEQVPYGVATSFINTLASSAFREIASIYGVETEIEWLKETIEDIKAVLADADHKQQTEQLIQRWMTKLKQVLYEADDLLDEIHTQHLLHKRDAKGKVCDFLSSSNPIAFRLKIARKIRKVREQFKAVTETVSRLNFDRRVVEMKHEHSSWRETSSKLEENITGREESEKEVTDLLLNTNDNQNVSLVAVVGIGGLGKTALAQLVYNNAKANKLFDKQMWVCVSEEFDVKALVKKVLESSIGNGVNDQSLELLKDQLEENLNGQRYLLVLDDVWTEDREKWLNLKKYLMCGAKEKCKGVPLAIRVMGSLLQSKSQESDWEDMLQDWIYDKDELIDLWMAQGFLENKDEKQCLEDVGEAYVRILLTKSFLQDVETDEFGEIKYFKMHDLMHDLSQSMLALTYTLGEEICCKDLGYMGEINS
ncbi:putative disease resistance protein RGA3 [Neltuma alba]|uniref:putative disease resistance protein RGA3 n=1 Tax=Neltuma alba TaxID=207710 RepID=UPI0010A59E28|nr:putative disease resistance protein RGA3 [Prosopis alba]